MFRYSGLRVLNPFLNGSHELVILDKAEHALHRETCADDLRFTSATSLHDGLRVLASMSDGTILLVDLSDPCRTQQLVMEGGNCIMPIDRVSVNPYGTDIVAFDSNDGRMQIASLSLDNKLHLVYETRFPHSSLAQGMRIYWHPTHHTMRAWVMNTPADGPDSVRVSVCDSGGTCVTQTIDDIHRLCKYSWWPRSTLCWHKVQHHMLAVVCEGHVSVWDTLSNTIVAKHDTLGVAHAYMSWSLFQLDTFAYFREVKDDFEIGNLCVQRGTHTLVSRSQFYMADECYTLVWSSASCMKYGNDIRSINIGIRSRLPLCVALHRAGVSPDIMAILVPSVYSVQ